MKTNKIKFILTGVAVAIISVVVFAVRITKIEPGYTGIVYSVSGGVQDETLSQGYHIHSPFEKVIAYSTSVEQGYLSKDVKEGSKDDDSFNIPTSDGKSVNVDLEYSYYFDVLRLPETFTQFKGQDGKTIEESFMRGKLKTWVGEISSKFSVIDIYGEQRQALNHQILEHVKAKFVEYGIVIETVNISRIGLDQQTEDAIQAKINMQQELETAKLDAEKAAIENEKRVAQAKAEAEAKLIQAAAEAEANAKLSESLTQELIDKMYIEKWNGSVPQVQGANTPILDMRIGESN